MDNRRTLVRTSLCACLALATALPAAAQDWSAVDTLAAAATRAHDFSGVVAVARDGQVIFERAYGHAHVGLGAPNTLETRFLIASLTKGFTAQAIRILAERGLLADADPLARFIPGFPAAERITLHHLLTHRAGVASLDTDTLGLEPASLDQQIARLAALPLDFEPGSDEAYSNGGYVLLAKVIEVAGGKSWARFLADEVFTPLGLSDTGVASFEHPIPRLATGHDPAPGSPPLALPRPFNLSYKQGSGALYSTSADLLRWGHAIAAEVAADPELAELPGWWVDDEDGTRVVSASGRLVGFAAGLQILPAERLVLVSLSNIRSGACRWIDRALLATALGQPLAPPTFAPYADLPVSTFEAAFGRYEAPDRLAVELASEDGAVTARLFLGGGSRLLTLTPRSATVLVDREYYTTYRLETDTAGAVTSLVFEDDSGNETLLPRVSPD